MATKLRANQGKIGTFSLLHRWAWSSSGSILFVAVLKQNLEKYFVKKSKGSNVLCGFN